MWKGDNMTKKATKEAPVLKFSKEQIVASKKYSPYKDFLKGNLEIDQMYSDAELDALIAKNYKKGIGE